MVEITTVSTGGLEIPVVRVKGSAYECGYQYGVTVAERIQNTVSAYLKAYRHHNNLDQHEVFELARKFLPVCEAYDATLVDEMRGIADGASLPMEAIVAINARSELVFGMQANLNDGCTSFAAFGQATADGRTLIGQNWDWKPALRGSLMVLEIRRDGDPAVITATEAGILAKFGFNNAGVASVVNFLLADQRKFGTPVHLIRRKVLRARTFDEAISAVLETERALSSNFLLGHQDGRVVDIEALPAGANIIEPVNGILAHANHFQGDIGDLRDLGIGVFPDTLKRDVRLRELLEAKSGAITVVECREALRDHDEFPNGICRHVDPEAEKDDQMETLGSLIIDLKDKVLHFTSGPPCETDYASVFMSD